MPKVELLSNDTLLDISWLNLSKGEDKIIQISKKWWVKKLEYYLKGIRLNEDFNLSIGGFRNIGEKSTMMSVTDYRQEFILIEGTIHKSVLKKDISPTRPNCAQRLAGKTDHRWEIKCQIFIRAVLLQL